MSNGQKIFFSFLAGVTVGALTGLVLAPEKGEIVRRRITEKAKEVQHDLKASWSTLSTRTIETRHLYK
ncbi:MAG: YtxH domain-containing protein [Thermonemataceae bacterium]|mgnify:CR=1 FL=1